ncbi:MAG: hypothetical protein Q9164_000942 [Protoblastenia rupestris]
MVPPAASDAGRAPQDTQEPVNPGQTNGSEQQIDSLRPGKKAPQKGKPNTINRDQEKIKAGEIPKDEKLSGKELKEKAKAEKAAKRAREKQGRHGQPVAEIQEGKQASKGVVKDPMLADSATPAAKSQHRRRSSASATGQKSLPLRPAVSEASSQPAEPKKEDKKVALLEHLYGHPRRTTIAGAAKDIHPSVLSLGLQLSSYEICGSNARSVALLLVLKQVIASYTTPIGTSLPRHLTTHLSSQIDYLVSCRPLSVSQGNAIRWLKVIISAIDINTPEHQAKNELCLAIDNFIRERITVADQVIAANAAERIKDGDVIMTYGKSSIIEKTLAEAYHQGKTFKVIVVDSRPLFEGKNIAKALAELGIEVQYSLIHGLSYVIKSATKAMLGVHAVMSNGRLYSRIGTAMVAMTAKDARLPVIVCCESIKFTDRVALDSFVHNEVAPPDELIMPNDSESENGEATLGTWKEVPNLQLLNLMYDVTPAEYVDVIVTEYGNLPPSSVPGVWRLSTNS